MLSYRHVFHAGNFADVIKHVVTVAVVTALQRKDTPCYLQDTHAGSGWYDLDTPQALKNREFDLGIGRILASAEQPPPAVAAYLNLVRQLCPGVSGIHRYPGSPALLRAMLRPHDRLLLTELHPADHAALAAQFRGDGQVQVHRQDAYQGLKAFLPPRERRGMVLIDPAYELKDEHDRVVRGLQTAQARWPQGVYLIWYPLLSTAQRARFHEGIRRTGIRKILCAEVNVATLTHHRRFVGSGLLIVNPPWRIDTELAAALPWLTKQLQQEPHCDHHLSWLVPE